MSVEELARNRAKGRSGTSMHIKIGPQIINTEAIAYAQVHEAGEPRPGRHGDEGLMPGTNEYEERVVELRLGVSEATLTTRLYGEEADLFLSAWPFYEPVVEE